MKNQEMNLTIFPSQRTSTIAEHIGMLLKDHNLTEEKREEVINHSIKMSKEEETILVPLHNGCMISHKPQIDIPVPNELYAFYQSAKNVHDTISNYMAPIDHCEATPVIILVSEKIKSHVSIRIDCADTDALAEGDGVYVNSYKFEFTNLSEHIEDNNVEKMLHKLHHSADTEDISAEIEDDVTIFTVIRSASENYTTLDELAMFAQWQMDQLHEGLSEIQQKSISLTVMVSTQ